MLCQERVKGTNPGHGDEDPAAGPPEFWILEAPPITRVFGVFAQTSMRILVAFEPPVSNQDKRVVSLFLRNIS